MKTTGKRSLTYKLTAVVAVVVAVVALLSSLAAWVSPSKIWFLALAGLGFNFIYPVNAFFLVLFLLKRKKAFFICLVPFLFGMSAWYHSFNFLGDVEFKNDSTAIKVMTYNVRLFDLYNWSHNLETRAKVFDFIRTEKPDIVSFQEFYSEDVGTFRNEDTLKQLLKLPYAHLNYTKTIKGILHFGIATYSRYPIVSQGEITFGNGKSTNNCIYTDLKINNDTIRVYNVHLESIRFRKEDYQFIENIEETDEAKDLQGGKKIITRLKRAFEKRAVEANQIADNIATCPYPVILCGDFNDTPSSYSYRIISGDLYDSFKKGSIGFESTYNGPFPSFRIDQILYDDHFDCGIYYVNRTALSDHFPVSCYFKIRNN